MNNKEEIFRFFADAGLEDGLRREGINTVDGLLSHPAAKDISTLIAPERLNSSLRRVWELRESFMEEGQKKSDSFPGAPQRLSNLLSRSGIRSLPELIDADLSKIFKHEGWGKKSQMLLTDYLGEIQKIAADVRWIGRLSPDRLTPAPLTDDSIVAEPISLPHRDQKAFAHEKLSPRHESASNYEGVDRKTKRLTVSQSGGLVALLNELPNFLSINPRHLYVFFRSLGITSVKKVARVDLDASSKAAAETLSRQRRFQIEGKVLSKLTSELTQIGQPEIDIEDDRLLVPFQDFLCGTESEEIKIGIQKAQKLIDAIPKLSQSLLVEQIDGSLFVGTVEARRRISIAKSQIENSRGFLPVGIAGDSEASRKALLEAAELLDEFVVLHTAAGPLIWKEPKLWRDAAATGNFCATALLRIFSLAIEVDLASLQLALPSMRDSPFSAPPEKEYLRAVANHIPWLSCKGDLVSYAGDLKFLRASKHDQDLVDIFCQRNTTELETSDLYPRLREKGYTTTAAGVLLSNSPIAFRLKKGRGRSPGTIRLITKPSKLRVSGVHPADSKENGFSTFRYKITARELATGRIISPHAFSFGKFQGKDATSNRSYEVTVRRRAMDGLRAWFIEKCIDPGDTVEIQRASEDSLSLTVLKKNSGG